MNYAGEDWNITSYEFLYWRRGVRNRENYPYVI